MPVKLLSPVVEVTRLLSKILKYNKVSVLHGDEYIVSKANPIVDHQPILDNRPTNSELELAMAIVNVQAEEMLSRSKAKAVEIISEAEGKAEEIREEAYRLGYTAGEEDGYEDGYNRAMAECNERLDRELDNLEELRKNIYDEKSILIKKSEEELVRLAMEVAEKIVGRALEDETTYSNFILNALKTVKGRGSIKVYVSQEDYERILDHKGYIVSAIDGLEDIEVIPDEYLRANSCIIDGGIGVIDASVDTQIEQIKKALESIFHYGDDGHV